MSQEEEVTLFILVFGTIGLSFLLFLLIFKFIIENSFLFFFKRPIYVHFYPIKRSLDAREVFILQSRVQFYQKLNPKRKKYFEHRVATFLRKYPLIPKEGLVITTEMRILIAATAIKLTFGMRHYLFSVFNKIVIYPSVYYSSVNEAWHKGEFNPRLKAIVFSWQDFLEGFDHSSSNINLGLHEFAHALHFHGLKSKDASASVFSEFYGNIMQYLKQKEHRDKLIASDYFRIYGFTNQFEFIAVILEHFFETPEQFEQEFPELFEKVRKMINFKLK
jgi:Mlc titration factor MtfA (ptsG expression regulator)